MCASSFIRPPRPRRSGWRTSSRARFERRQHSCLDCRPAGRRFRSTASSCGCTSRAADFSRATTFNLDEFVGLSPRDPRSYHAFMRRHLFDGVNLAPDRIEFLNGQARDMRREARRYERRIAAVGGLDLVLLGIGGNGHLGFNEPAARLVSRTHLSTLRPATRRANAWCSTATCDACLVARSRWASARSWARAGRAPRDGPRQDGNRAARAHRADQTRVPASLFQLHPNVVVVLDREAGRGLASS